MKITIRSWWSGGHGCPALATLLRIGQNVEIQPQSFDSCNGSPGTAASLVVGTQTRCRAPLRSAVTTTSSKEESGDALASGESESSAPRASFSNTVANAAAAIQETNLIILDRPLRRWPWRG